MVIVCGDNMGDIFRRNAFNLGLHVVQSPEAVADAQDGDAFAFDPGRARARPTRRRGRPTTPVPLTAEGRRDPPRAAASSRSGRREFRASVRARAARSSGPTPRRARRMTTTEQIVWAHRVDKDADGRARARRCASTPTCCPPPTARRRSRSTPSTRSPAATRSTRARRRSPTTTSSSPARTTTTGRRRSAAQFAAAARHREAVLRRRPATASSTSTSPSRASCCPGSSSPAPTRTAAPTAPTARSASASARRRSASAGRPATSTSRWPKQRRVVFRGRLQPWVTRQGHRARAAAPLGREAVAGHVGRVRRRRPAAADRLPQHDREHDGRGRGAERHLRAGRDHRRLVSREGHRPTCRTRASRPAPTRVYEIDETLDLADVAPMIAKPFSPGNAFPAEEVARERITFDKAMIGSCTNGSYDDLLQAALVLARRARAGLHEGRAASSSIFPGSGGVEAADRAARPAARRRVDRRRVPRGGRRDPRSPGAARASARARTRSTPGQRAITSFNRNWQNRMGLGGEGYLASPAVVAASALAGLHGAAERAGPRLGARGVRRLAAGPRATTNHEDHEGHEELRVNP